MINKETWKIRTAHDEMETLIKYHMHIHLYWTLGIGEWNQVEYNAKL